MAAASGTPDISARWLRMHNNIFKAVSHIASLLLVLCATACSHDVPAAPPSDNGPPPFALKDIYKGVAWVGGRREIPDDAWTQAQAYGIEWVALTPFGWMDTQYAPAIRLNPDARLWGESDQGLRVTTQTAHAHGIKVMLKPHVWLMHPVNDGWIGEIDFASEDLWRQWEASYRTFIMHYARLAEEEHIEILCLATELSNPARTRPQFWKALANEVRQVYSGQLTYAANWYRDFDETEIWSALDYIGINAYFPLTDRDSPSVQELVECWQPYIRQIEKVAQTYRKPVLLTEVGYKNTRGATSRPWEWPRRLDFVKSDESEQVNAYEALFLAFGRQDWFKGLFIWKWYPNQEWLSSDRIEFSPQKKQAAEVLKKWYVNKGEG